MADRHLIKSAPESQGGKQWKIIGISGVSGSGKTTLATQLLSSLPTTTAYLSQDQYILPNDYPGHLKAPPPLQGLNKDAIQSIATDRMEDDLRKFLLREEVELKPLNFDFRDRKTFVGSALISPNPFYGHKRNSELSPVLLLDGFLLFNHHYIPPICDIRFFLTLTKEQCWERRKQRTFTLNSMNAGDYFEMCMWPTYESNFKEMVTQVRDVEFLDGASPPDEIYKKVFARILDSLQSP